MSASPMPAFAESPAASAAKLSAPSVKLCASTTDAEQLGIRPISAAARGCSAALAFKNAESCSSPMRRMSVPNAKFTTNTKSRIFAACSSGCNKKRRTLPS